MSNEKLGSIGVGAGIGHREGAGTVMLEVFVELVLKLVSGTAGTGSLGAASLNHEVRDDAVEGQAIVETIIGEFLKICDRFGHLVVVQLESDVSAVGLNQGNFHLGYGGLQRAKKTIWSVTDYTLPGSPGLEGVAGSLIRKLAGLYLVGDRLCQQHR